MVEAERQAAFQVDMASALFLHSQPWREECVCVCLWPASALLHFSSYLLFYPAHVSRSSSVSPWLCRFVNVLGSVPSFMEIELQQSPLFTPLEWHSFFRPTMRIFIAEYGYQGGCHKGYVVPLGVKPRMSCYFLFIFIYIFIFCKAGVPTATLWNHIFVELCGAVQECCVTVVGSSLHLLTGHQLQRRRPPSSRLN